MSSIACACQNGVSSSFAEEEDELYRLNSNSSKKKYNSPNVQPVAQMKQESTPEKNQSQRDRLLDHASQDMNASDGLGPL